MPKAKTIDRLEYTKSISIVYQPVPVRVVDMHYDEERNVVFANDRPGVEICPVCGAEVIHEAGCVRCTCGWSRC